MHKNKPFIVSRRPLWRHYIFPWGWYSIVMDFHKLSTDEIIADGYRAPNDGGGGVFCWDNNCRSCDEDGDVTIRIFGK